MLQDALQRRGKGRCRHRLRGDHGRPETEALAARLEAVPPATIDYQGLTLREMDLDAVLERHPEIALIDELAHTNAPNSRHVKRYEDVEELLHAGISVYTTVNIQHVESQNDAVAQITGIRVSETLPDTFISGADEIRLVDVTRRSCGSASGQGRSMSGIWPRRRYAGSSAPETSSPCGSSPCATWRPPPTCR